MLSTEVLSHKVSSVGLSRRLANLESILVLQTGVSVPLVLPQPLQAGFEQAKVVGRLLPQFDANSPKNIDLLARMKLGSAVQLSASNAKAAPSWDDSRLKAHAVAPLDLAQHQGIGMFVVGDGSGGTVVVRVICGTTARDYAVPLSFHGKRWVEIPSSEAGLRHRAWGAVGKGAALWYEILTEI